MPSEVSKARRTKWTAAAIQVAGGAENALQGIPEVEHSRVRSIAATIRVHAKQSCNYCYGRGVVKFNGELVMCACSTRRMKISQERNAKITMK